MRRLGRPRPQKRPDIRFLKWLTFNIIILAVNYFQLFDKDNHLNKHPTEYLFTTEGHIFPISKEFRKKPWETEENINFKSQDMEQMSEECITFPQYVGYYNYKRSPFPEGYKTNTKTKLFKRCLFYDNSNYVILTDICIWIKVIPFDLGTWMPTIK